MSPIIVSSKPNSEILSPPLWHPADDLNEDEERKKLFPMSNSIEMNVVRSVGGVLMPRKISEFAHEIFHFEVRPDDVWIVTFPKCGTTWMQEIIWHILHDVDLINGRSHIFSRSPFLELCTLDQTNYDPNSFYYNIITKSIEYARNLPSPRVIKTHLPFEFLPPNLLDIAKVVYVARNPKDCCVSYFHHVKLYHRGYGFEGNFEEYADLFKNGEINYGCYWNHLKSGWNARNHSNVHFLWYEDLLENLTSNIAKLCNFIGYPLSPDKISDLARHVSFANYRQFVMDFSKNDQEKLERGKFFRRGVKGDSKRFFTPEMNLEWDERMQRIENEVGIKIPA